MIGHARSLSLSRPLVNHLASAETITNGFSQSEVSAIVCDPTDASSFEDHIAKVDVVIDAVGGPEIAKVGHVILDASIKQAKASRPQGPPLSYIYCSGMS